MKWIEIAIGFRADAPAFAEDLIAAAFADAGIQGVVLTPEEDLPEDDWAREVLPRPAVENKVTGYVADTEAAGDILRRLDSAVQALGARHGFDPHITLSTLDEEDWAESWKAFFWPEKISETLVVKPTWRTYIPGAGERVIEIDPGMAFGTGTHPTTALCARLIETLVTPGSRFLDVGTGSGILMVAAYLSGAAVLRGVDIDPVAVAVARENLLRNKVPIAISSVGAGDLTREVTGPFDVVSANILSEVIVRLLDQIPAILAPGGQIICSGITEENEGLVIDKMRATGFALTETRRREGWVALVGRRPA